MNELLLNLHGVRISGSSRFDHALTVVLSHDLSYVPQMFHLRILLYKSTFRPTVCTLLQQACAGHERCYRFLCILLCFTVTQYDLRFPELSRGSLFLYPKVAQQICIMLICKSNRYLKSFVPSAIQLLNLR